MASNLLKGTMILTIGLLLSRIIGILYVIPFYQIIGEEYIALYQYAYTPYSIMLAIAVSGVPIAVSKFVSKYNALGDYATGRKLVKSSMLLMIVTGILGFLVLYFLADPIAHLIIKDDEADFSVNDVASVIKFVSFAVIVVPVMSLVRGFFQGYQHMTPTAVSQLWEQIVRILFVLVGGFFVVYIFNGTEKTAVSFAVFAAFLGAIASMFVLYWYWRKLKPEFNSLLNSSGRVSSDISLTNIYKEMLIYTVPFALVGVINPLFQFIDMITFNSAMSSIGIGGKVSNILLGMLNFSAHKLVMIPVMLATGFSMALIPYITSYYAKKDFAQVRKSLDQTFQILLFLTVPAAMGISILADEFYLVFYEASETGATVLAHYAPVAILFALYPVTTSILQGIDRQKLIILNLLLGILTKLVLNTPLIKAFETDGAIMATACGYLVAIGLNLFAIRKTLHYKSNMVVRRIMLIIIVNIAMLVLVFIVKLGFGQLISIDTKLDGLMVIIVCAGIGAAFYAFVTIRLGLAQKLFGERLTRFTKKFGL
ncbi:Membrane protein involved in the export of O-antigen and teichoic acid [Psychrobacillus sp. OK028]|uniref:putative polysaccharide biosynthesis protein n=1 Tax=Psychrobacillus sp. OK028 TaxID=1884359 RepID=UPI0008816A05|nr:polysaccharide biosynthesis protein [Psychrobacillus sp. OK028]SDM71169.1 Membrane protein involved in the export of O-antigen and teichoic acid [Psychrobacillus sp. OK028]